MKGYQRSRPMLLGASLAGVLLAGTIHGGDPTYDADHAQQRAGCPNKVACYAHPSETTAYVGYRVGGGSPCYGGHPSPAEGTWGWDYQGCLFPRRVFLCWWHGRCYQGGTGAYKTDGPKLHPRDPKKCE